eukprot:evm.model.scf_322.4 EVM.evm.TU.scf_322.4   scf_322:80745-87058(+)
MFGREHAPNPVLIICLGVGRLTRMGILEGLNAAIENARATLCLSNVHGLGWASSAWESFVGKPEQEDDLESVSTSERPRIASIPLSLYDDFQVISGIPVFILGNPEPAGTDPDIVTHRPSVDITEGLDFANGFLQSPFNVTSCALSEDGIRLISANAGGGVRVWDTQHGNLLCRMYGYHSSKVDACTFRAMDSNVALTCDRSGGLAEWDVTSGKPPKVYDISRGWEPELFTKDEAQPAFSPGGDILAVVLPAVADAYFVLGNELKKWRGEADGRGTNTVVRASYLYLYEMAQLCEHPAAGLNLQVAWKHNRNYDNAGLEWSPNGKRLLCGFRSSYASGFVVLWPDIDKAQQRSFSLWGSTGVFSSDSSRLITWDPVLETQYGVSHTHECRVWDIAKLKSVAGYEWWHGQSTAHPKFQVPRDGAKDMVTPFTLRHEAGERVLWCNFLWDCATCRVATCVMTSGIARTLKVIIWDVPTQTPIHALDAGKAGLLDRSVHLLHWAKDLIRGASSIAVSKGGRNRVALYMAPKNEGYIWDARYGVVTLRFELPPEVVAGSGTPYRLEFSQDGRKFLMYGADKVLVWNICDPEQGTNVDLVETKVETSNALVDGMFSHDGEKVGILQADRETIFIWDCQDAVLHEVSLAQQEMASIHSRRFSRFNFSRSGESVVACVQEGNIFLWALDGQVTKRSLKQDSDDDEPKMAPTVSSRRYARVGAMYSDPSSAKSDDPCRAICFSHDQDGSETVVAFREDGALIWFEVRPGTEDSIIYKVKGEPETRCVFSCCGTRALVFDKSEGTKIHIWDLVHRMKVRTVEYRINLNDTHGFPTNVSPTDGAFAVVGMRMVDGVLDTVLCHPDTHLQDLHIDHAATNLSVSEEGHWMVTDEVVEAENVFGVQYHTARIPSINTITSKRLWVTSVDGSRRPKRLLGNYLSPENFLLASHDGRRVACASAKNKFMIWTATAIQGSLPDYNTLKVMNKTSDSPGLKNLLDQFGPAMFNYPSLNGLSVFLAAIQDENEDMVATMIEWALEEKVKVSLFTYKQDQVEQTNGLQIAIDKRSPDLTRKLLDALLAGLTTQTVLIDVFEESLLNLGKVYPPLLTEVIGDPRMLQMIGETHCAEGVFGVEPYFLTETSNKYWPATHALEELWRELKPETAAAGDVRLTADAKVIPYPDIAQIGMEGILRPLLLEGMPKKIFASKMMLAVINFKWETYARELLLEEITHYVLMVLFFTAYAIVLGHRRHSMQDVGEVLGGSLGAPSLVLMISTAFLAFTNFVRELKQIKTYIKEFPKTKHEGLRVWLSSKWNVMEFMSYIFLVVVIPVLHLTAIDSANQVQSVAVGMATILVWWKMLYYFLGFKPTGPLVIMIFEIVKDIVFFLVVALGLLLGFGIAFFVLYRHDVLLAKDDRSEETQFFLDQFESVDRSLFTMFGMMLGDFELTWFYDAQLAPWALILFVVYMVSMMIILLNLLIAIMGDTYDRVKDVEDVAFLHARATVIDDAESMLSEGKKAQLKKRINKFLHVLEPQSVDGASKGGEWQGKLVVMERRFRKTIEQQMAVGRETLLKEMETKLAAQVGYTDDLGGELMAQVESSMRTNEQLQDMLGHLQAYFQSRGGRPSSQLGSTNPAHMSQSRSLPVDEGPVPTPFRLPPLNVADSTALADEMMAEFAQGGLASPFAAASSASGGPPHPEESDALPDI